MFSLIFSLLIIVQNLKIADTLCCDCTGVRTGKGCPPDLSCEQEMCYGNIIPALPDSFCCLTSWDTQCSTKAQTICNLTPSPTTTKTPTTRAPTTRAPTTKAPTTKAPTTKTPTTKTPTKLPTIKPTLSPTYPPKISCNSNIYCYYIDIYPSLTSPVSQQIAIQNKDENVQTYFDIMVTPKDRDCVSPSISFQFELIDHDQDNEYLDIFNNDNTRIRKCQGGSQNNCPNWDTCLTDKDVGVSSIKMNNQYTIRVIQPSTVHAYCNHPGDHDLSINAILTFQCAAGTASPTPSPTSDPTSAPTPSPTNHPTPAPTAIPTAQPTHSTAAPTKYPTNTPTTKSPTLNPTLSPTPSPTTFPTPSPTTDPTPAPTINPTAGPTDYPTTDPTIDPTLEPTMDPTDDPTSDPTTDPTAAPTFGPTKGLIIHNQNRPTMSPTTTETTANTMGKTSNTQINRGAGIDSAGSNNSGPFSYILISSIGALFIILCIGSCLLLYCRRKKQHKLKSKEGDMDTSMHGIVAEGKQQQHHHIKVQSATGIEMYDMMRIQSASAYDTDHDVIDGMDDTFITPMGIAMDDGMITPQIPTPEPNIVNMANIELPQLPPHLPQLPVATENDNEIETQNDEHNSSNNDGEHDDEMYQDIGITATPYGLQQYDNDDDDDDDDEQLYTDPDEEQDDNDVIQHAVTTGGGGDEETPN